MTTRNLNRTWRDIVFSQYSSDLEAEAPFPIRYIINTPQWQQDIIIDIPNQLDIKSFKQAILAFFKAKHTDPDPTYTSEYISIRSRQPAQHDTPEVSPPTGPPGDDS